MSGGVVFVSGVSGTGTGEYLQRVVEEARAAGHAHEVEVHDVGQIMREYAERDNPGVNWDLILDADEVQLRLLRSLALEQVAGSIAAQPAALHLIDMHLSFRWRAFLTKGIDVHALEPFRPKVRCFVNLIQDLSQLQERLKSTTWGDREILELLVWRDEELFLSTLYADMLDRSSCFVLPVAEPAAMLERIIWHPEVSRVYLSFPITAIQDDDAAKEEIRQFRDRLRESAVVFDPYASKDYDETYTRPEMRALRKQIGEVTKVRDFRFIDQAQAVVVYYPRRVESKGVDAEMLHAHKTGKPIYVYCPEDLGGGPFAVAPSHFRSDPDQYLTLLKEHLGPRS